jgi:hypothetical protein
VRVEAQGFRTAVRHAQLELNQTARLDFNLVIGEITQVAEIAAMPPLLQTDTTQLGTVIDSRTNVTLPLASRNYVQLTLLSPGSVNPNPQTLTGAGTSANSGRPYINGNREQANNFMLDGLDNNQVSDNLVGYAPSPEAIQEFNLITNNAPAEFGSFQGGIVSVTIKSGTNGIPRQRLRVLPQRRVERQYLEQQLQRHREAQGAMESVRRQRRRPDHQRQIVLLRRLPGAALQRPDEDRRDHRSHKRAASGQFLGHLFRVRREWRLQT